MESNACCACNGVDVMPAFEEPQAQPAPYPAPPLTLVPLLAHINPTPMPRPAAQDQEQVYDTVVDSWLLNRSAPLEQQVAGLRLVLACLAAWGFQYPLTEDRTMELLLVGAGAVRSAKELYTVYRCTWCRGNAERASCLPGAAGRFLGWGGVWLWLTVRSRQVDSELSVRSCQGHTGQATCSKGEGGRGVGPCHSWWAFCWCWGWRLVKLV